LSEAIIASVVTGSSVFKAVLLSRA
jgi:hypothetical protein